METNFITELRDGANHTEKTTYCPTVPSDVHRYIVFITKVQHL